MKVERTMGKENYKKYMNITDKCMEKLSAMVGKSQSLVLLAGRPDTGKTTLAVRIAHYEEKHKNRKTLYFSLESSDFHLNYEFNDEEELEYDDSFYLTVEDIKEKLEKRKERADLIIIDHLQLMGYKRSNRPVQEEFLQQARKLKNLAVEYDTTILVLSQLPASIDCRKDKRPVIQDLNIYGREFENTFDVISFIYSDKEFSDSRHPNNNFRHDFMSCYQYREVQCDVVKNLNGKTESFPIECEDLNKQFVLRFKNEFLDKISSMIDHPSSLIMLGGRPGIGKSCLSGGIVRHEMKRNKRILYISLEMSEDQLRLKCGLDDSEKLKIEDPLCLPINEIRKVLISKRKRYDLIIIDYLQLILPEYMGKPREIDMYEISCELKKLAEEANVTILVLTQLSRIVDYRGGRPILNDLYYTGYQMEEYYDIILFLYSDSEYRYYDSDRNFPYHSYREVKCDVVKNLYGDLESFPLECDLSVNQSDGV